MKTNRASGFACVFAVAVIAACSGSQENAVDDQDGGGLDGGLPDVYIGSTATNTGVATTGATSTGLGTASEATSETTPSGTGVTGATGTATSTGTTIAPGDGGGGVCPSTCTTNDECQTGCPAVAGALNCCDSVTMACFQSASSACPGSTTGGGGGTDGGGGGGY